MSAPDTLLYQKIVCSPSKDTIIAIAYSLDYKSTYIVYSKNYGSTWDVQKTNFEITVNAPLMTLNGTLYSTTKKTNDWGRTVTDNSLGISTYAIAPNGNFIYRGFSDIYVSKDHGKSWNAKNISLGQDTDATITLPSGRILILGKKAQLETDNKASIIYSDNNGETFSPVKTPPGQETFPSLPPSVAYVNGSLYYKNNNSLMVSDDEGLNWQYISTPSYHFAVVKIFSVNNELYAIIQSALSSDSYGLMKIKPSKVGPFINSDFTNAIGKADVSFKDADVGKNNDIFAVSEENPSNSTSNHGRGIYKISFSATNANRELIDNNVIVYPNPVQDNFIQLGLSKKINTQNIFIRDIAGKVIKTVNYNAFNVDLIKVEIADIPKGSYFLTFNTLDGKTQTCKFTKI